MARVTADGAAVGVVSFVALPEQATKAAMLSTRPQAHSVLMLPTPFGLWRTASHR
ncbi:hypothetical protein GCM10010299_35280 [Streptomyces tanashiensis]|nr:hypothetical protein GCM10010299_35280 [Streptomyces tanashiensis]